LEGYDGVLQDKGHPIRDAPVRAQEHQKHLIYTQLVDFPKEDEFICKVATTNEEISKLIEAGFEYVCDYNRAKFFKKRK